MKNKKFTKEQYKKDYKVLQFKLLFSNEVKPTLEQLDELNKIYNKFYSSAKLSEMRKEVFIENFDEMGEMIIQDLLDPEISSSSLVRMKKGVKK